MTDWARHHGNRPVIQGTELVVMTNIVTHSPPKSFPFRWPPLGLHSDPSVLLPLDEHALPLTYPNDWTNCISQLLKHQRLKLRLSKPNSTPQLIYQVGLVPLIEKYRRNDGWFPRSKSGSGRATTSMMYRGSASRKQPLMRCLVNEEYIRLGIF